MHANRNVVVVNTHPDNDPAFVEVLVERLEELGVHPRVVAGYRGEPPVDEHVDHVLLTGVPLDVQDSLSDASTRTVIDEHFGRLKQCQSPVLGICFGHHILAHVFGGEISTLPSLIRDEEYLLNFEAQAADGIFGAARDMAVSAEHRDYVSKVPDGSVVLSKRNHVPYAFHLPERQMYGAQFVPELSGEAGRRILKRFVAM